MVVRRTGLPEVQVRRSFWVAILHVWWLKPNPRLLPCREFPACIIVSQSWFRASALPGRPQELLPLMLVTSAGQAPQPGDEGAKLRANVALEALAAALQVRCVCVRVCVFPCLDTLAWR